MPDEFRASFFVFIPPNKGDPSMFTDFSPVFVDFSRPIGVFGLQADALFPTFVSTFKNQTSMNTKRQETFPRHGRSVRESKINTFFVAGFFIIVGLMLLGKNLGWVGSYWFRIVISWQMLLIVIGVSNLFKRQYIAGIVTAGIGAVFMFPLIDKDIDRLLWGNLWPLVFVVVGVSILFRRNFNRSFLRGNRPDDPACTYDEHLSEDGFLVSENTFGAVQQIVLDPVFRGGMLKCTFGSTVVDLRRTSLEAPETYVDVECTFGGIEMYVPANWNVQTQLECVFGGNDDKRYHVTLTDADHVLVLRGKVTFGGIELKN